MLLRGVKAPAQVSPTKLMKKFAFTLPFVFIVFSACGFVASGQEQPRPAPREAVQPAMVPLRAQPVVVAQILGANYRITFSGASGDKSLGELSALTCAPKIEIHGALNPAGTSTILHVTGTLEEKEGCILFSYAIGFRVPQVAADKAPSPSQPQPPKPAIAGPAAPGDVQYQELTATANLLMKPGKTYQLLKAGGNVFTVVVKPEPDKKRAKRKS